MKEKAEDALDYVLSSKTLGFILGMTMILIIAFLAGAVAINILHWESPVSSGELIEVWKWATGAGTTRNIISDGVMPRAGQIVGSIKDPSVSNKPVQPMMAIDKPPTFTAASKSYIPPTTPPSIVIPIGEE